MNKHTDFMECLLYLIINIDIFYSNNKYNLCKYLLKNCISSNMNTLHTLYYSTLYMIFFITLK